MTTHVDRIFLSTKPSPSSGEFNVPDPLPVLDNLLAATASVHGSTLVTRSLKDVKRTGVDCLNLFSA